MNWERGFKRIFWVAAVCWVAFFLMLAFQKDTQNADAVVVIAFAVPAAAYVLFFVILPWIGRGFKK